MDETPIIQPVSQVPPAPVMPVVSTEIEKLKKRVRNAGWAATTVGYVYLLFMILGVLALAGSLSLLFNNVASAGALGQFRSFLMPLLMTLAAPVIGAFVIFLTLINLGKRLTTIQKGFMWKAGEMRMDRNFKLYLQLLAALTGFQVLVHVATMNVSLDGIIALILFIFVGMGLMAANRLYAMPEFAATLETPAYKRTTKFWTIMVVVAIVLQLSPLFIGFLVPSPTADGLMRSLDATNESADLPLDATNQ